MKNKKTLITFILIGILLILAIAVNIIALNGKNEVKENIQVQSNVSTEVENTVEANVITEENLELTGEKYIEADVKDANDIETILEVKDNPMIIVFWNISNENSVEALKTVQAFYEDYSEKINFNCVTVIDEVKETKENVEKFISENNITMPIVYDSKDNSLIKANNVTKIPTILIINKNAEIINTLTNEINEDIVEANLDILSENY